MSEPGRDPASHAGFEDELRIDWIRPEQLGSATGSLGLTILPGKRGRSTRYPGRTYRRDLDADIIALREAGVVRLVLLVEDVELARWSDPHLVRRAAALGLEVLRHPIADGQPPGSDELRAILDEIGEARRRGNVAVACMGGVGRTGTIAACALVQAGRTAGEAIRTIREIRHPTAVETAEQEAFVEAYASGLAREGRP